MFDTLDALPVIEGGPLAGGGDGGGREPRSREVYPGEIIVAAARPGDDGTFVESRVSIEARAVAQWCRKLSIVRVRIATIFSDSTNDRWSDLMSRGSITVLARSPRRVDGGST